MTKTLPQITKYWSVFEPLSYRRLADIEKPFGVFLISICFKRLQRRVTSTNGANSKVRQVVKSKITIAAFIYPITVALFITSK